MKPRDEEMPVESAKSYKMDTRRAEEVIERGYSLIEEDDVLISITESGLKKAIVEALRSVREPLEKRIKKLENVLRMLLSGLTPCSVCKKVHVPYKPDKNTAFQWDKDGHPYRKESIEVTITEALAEEGT